MSTGITAESNLFLNYLNYGYRTLRISASGTGSGGNYVKADTIYSNAKFIVNGQEYEEYNDKQQQYQIGDTFVYEADINTLSALTDNNTIMAIGIGYTSSSGTDSDADWYHCAVTKYLYEIYINNIKTNEGEHIESLSGNGAHFGNVPGVYNIYTRDTFSVENSLNGCHFKIILTATEVQEGAGKGRYVYYTPLSYVSSLYYLYV